MDCIHHPGNPIGFICIAPHQCSGQRKLCAKCLLKHAVDLEHTISIKTFNSMINEKIKGFRLDETSIIKNKLLSFRNMLLQTINMLKKIFKEIDESIKQIKQLLNMIEEERNSMIKLINKNTDLTEYSQTDLEKLVKFLERGLCDDWIASNNPFLDNLEQKEELYLTLIKKLTESGLPYLKQSISEILASSNNFNSQLLSNLISILKKEEISDCISFFSNHASQQIIEEHFHQMNLSPPSQLDIQYLTNVLKNIQELDFYIMNFSLDQFEENRKSLVAQITEQKLDEKCMLFLKFLVHLTAIDSKFIQCGSNSLNLLVELGADLKDQNFYGIRIKDTSLIGANFSRSNLSGSIFDNVDISGMNLNSALLINCQWKNLKIQELNKLEGHTKTVKSICFSADGNTLASGSEDYSICLWDVKTGKLKQKLYGHLRIVNTLCYSPNDTVIAVGFNDCSICLYQ